LLRSFQRAPLESDQRVAAQRGDQDGSAKQRAAIAVAQAARALRQRDLQQVTV
jgi:hypothetical protein